MNHDETRIRELFAHHARAIADRDAGAALTVYAPQVLRFDLAPPLWSRDDARQGREALEAWFATWEGPIEMTFSRLEVSVDGDLGIVHGFVRLAGTKAGGAREQTWARYTAGVRKAPGGWRIFHEHTSVPFAMDGSLRAQTQLEP